MREELDAALQAVRTGFETRDVLAVNVPVVDFTRKPEEIARFYKEVVRRVSELPGVNRVAVGTAVPWRDKGFFEAQFTVEGYAKANGEEDPRARFRTVTPGFFSALGVPLVSGRDFNDDDRRDGELVVIVSESLARRMFPNQDAVNRHLMWTDPVTKFIGVSNGPRRIVGVVADLDDENVVPGPTITVYHPLEQEIGGGRLFVHSKERNRWLQILAIATAGGKLGRSWTDDPQSQRRLRTSPVGWDFTSFATRPYIDQPLKTSASIAFPDRITFDEATAQYELRYFSSFGVPSAETVLFIKKIDLILSFLRR